MIGESLPDKGRMRNYNRFANELERLGATERGEGAHGDGEGTAVKIECYPIEILPRPSRLFLDFAQRREALAPFFPASAYSTEWMTAPPVLAPAHRATLCDLLEQQNRDFGAADQVFQNIARLRNGAGAVVTGQQVTLFGGPLFTILKAATVIRKAKDASASGSPHVPIFWLATEDHDLAEVDHVTVALPATS